MEVVVSHFPGLLHQSCNFLRASIKVAALHPSPQSFFYPPSLLVLPIPSPAFCMAVIHALLPFLPLLTLVLLSMCLTPPPPSLLFSLALSVFPALGHRTCCSPHSDCMLALPFHAVCVHSSFSEGRMSVLNHMIFPNDKPSLCNSATWKEESYVG